MADSTIKSLWAVPLIHSRQYKIIHFVQCKKLVYCRAVRNSYFAEVQDTCREKLSYVKIIYEQYNLFIMSNKNFFIAEQYETHIARKYKAKLSSLKKITSNTIYSFREVQLLLLLSGSTKLIFYRSTVLYCLRTEKISVFRILFKNREELEKG